MLLPNKFANQEAFDRHKQGVLSLIWKLKLMLLECSYRILIGHDNEEEENTYRDINEVLTRWEQISRYVEVLTITFNETVNSLVPREYVKFSLIHPGLYELHAELLHGPLTLALFLQKSWNDAMPVLKDPKKKNTEVEAVRAQIKTFYLNIFVLMHDFKAYLDKAYDAVENETWINAMMKKEVFSYYSLLPKMDEEVYHRVARNLTASHKQTVKGLLRVLDHLNKVPRVFS